MESKRIIDSFDIGSVSKRMPYKPLPEGYFEAFASKAMAKIEEETLERRESAKVRENRRWGLVLSSSIAVAASVVVALTTMLLDTPVQQFSTDAFDSNLEMYVESLSDEALSSLYYEIESTELFFNNL